MDLSLFGLLFPGSICVVGMAAVIPERRIIGACEDFMKEILRFRGGSMKRITAAACYAAAVSSGFIDMVVVMV
jgi:hypothetical protein